MIDARELRIGNYLQRLDGSIFQITIDDLKIIFNWIANKDLLPKGILLTEEWLVKFNFNKFIDKLIIDNIIHSVSVKYEKNGLCLKFEGVLNAKGILKYVHQFQNLYFALTGEELIFNDVT
jgi:hypothetical protein